MTKEDGMGDGTGVNSGAKDFSSPRDNLLPGAGSTRQVDLPAATGRSAEVQCDGGGG